jgi:hypothetical protein
MASISDFLNGLVESDDLQAEFELHPRRAMNRYQLDDEQQALILGGDLAELREAIQGENDSNVVVFLIKMRP